MNKTHSFRYFLLALLSTGVLLLNSCKKADHASEDQSLSATKTALKRTTPKVLDHFLQVNLVANTGGYGSNTRIDPTLVNAWGIAFTANGGAWVTSQGGHVSDIYTSEGAPSLQPVNIPSPDNATGGQPTGIIANPNSTDFIIPSGNGTISTGARFIFVGLDGIVSAWNGTWGTSSFRKLNLSATSAFTGLAIANNGGNNFLYAANFRAGKINVWNNTWAPVPMSFKDPELPEGYSPFNIQNINNQLYVTYAKLASTGKNDPGIGKGFVDIYNPDGSFVKRFASEGTLNSPWGLALAPASLFSDDDDNDGQTYVLVGNFGDGTLNAFRLSDGKFKGQLGKHKEPIVIEGLWAISFPPATSTVDPQRLYFAAGPAQETQGLFGYITIEKNTD